MGTLQGKVALVTGSSRGIGRAIALRLARDGADVIINYVARPDDLAGAERNAQDAAAVVAEIEAMGRRAIAVQADVSKADEAAALVKTGVEALGGLNILVNNAGVTRDTLLMRMSEADWDVVMQVNLKGPFNVCKAALRYLLKQSHARIINIASVSGLMGQVGQANYAASKAGLIGFTRSLARELGPRGVTVNAIAPGYVPTDLTASLADEWKQTILQLTPLGRFGTVDDIAAAVAFLASEEAGFITGVVLPVDGGLSM